MSILSTLNKLTGKKDTNVLAALNSLTGKTADDIEEAVGNLTPNGGGDDGGDTEFGPLVNIGIAHMYLDACPVEDLSNQKSDSDLEGRHSMRGYNAAAWTRYIATVPGKVEPNRDPGMLLYTDGMDGYRGFVMGYDGNFEAAGGLYVSIEIHGTEISTMYAWDPERYTDQKAVLFYKKYNSDDGKAIDVTDWISPGMYDDEASEGALLIHVPLIDDITLGDDDFASLYIYGLGAVPGE